MLPKKSIPLQRTIKYIVIFLSHSLREEFSMASVIDIAVDFLSLFLDQVQSVTDRRAIRQWETLFVHLPHGLLHWVKSSPGPALMGKEITWSSRWGAVCHGTRLTSVVFADLFQEQCLRFVFLLFGHRFSSKKEFHYSNYSVFKQTTDKRKVRKSAIINAFLNVTKFVTKQVKEDKKAVQSSKRKMQSAPNATWYGNVSFLSPLCMRWQVIKHFYKLQ